MNQLIYIYIYIYSNDMYTYIYIYTHEDAELALKGKPPTISSCICRGNALTND